MVVSVINTERQLYHSIFSYEKGANSVSLRRQSGLREIKLLAQSAESERAKVLSWGFSMPDSMCLTTNSSILYKLTVWLLEKKKLSSSTL